MKMTNINYITIILFSILVSSCEKNFDEINTNTVDPIEGVVDPVFILNNAIIGLSFPNDTNIIYEAGIVQQIISPNSGVLTGANYNQDNRTGTEDQWNDAYENVIKHTSDVINQVKDDSDKSNLLNIARIVQAYAFMVLVDTYGDVPYFEAGNGRSEGIVLPSYDSGETIYADIIKELKEASAALNPSGDDVQDVMYAGDFSQWKKFANALLLRAAMRHTEKDMATAEQLVADAVAAGLMTSNEDNFVVRHDNNFTNPYGPLFNGTEANNVYLVDTFIDYLDNTEDPRLGVLSIRYIGAASGPDQTLENASKNPGDQIGMPMGHDNSTIGAQATADGLESFYAYSQMDRFLMGMNDAPAFHVTYAQTQLLLAEAATYGWVSGDAATYYENGVRAHMEQFASYGPGGVIASSDVDAYLIANPFDSANALEQINTQYWVASFLNGPEAWSNYRRSGYPELAPNPYPAQDITGEFINRLTYPNSEIAVNKENLDAAVNRMGPDNLDTKVWWDE